MSGAGGIPALQLQGREDVNRRIYELSREVIEFQRATRPLPEILQG